MPQFQRPNRQILLLSFLTAILCIPVLLSAQADSLTSTLTYSAPLRGPLLVTGTFGELRSDHFHAGLDFRAPTNTAVYAVADGFVSRVLVSPGGYGQAIYVDHPDGHRSVYAHLETLKKELLDTIRTRQFADHAFPVDLRFNALSFPVKQGDYLGGVGNRGHSFGPHLHFEMRDIDGDAPLNPLAFGFDVPDTRQPQIRKLRVYELDEHGLETKEQTIIPNRGHEGQYFVADTVFVSTSLVGLGLKTYDQQNGMPNWNGIYGGDLFTDTTSVFSFRWDRLPFEDTEYLNALTDYTDWTENESWFHRFWALTQDAMFWTKKAGPAPYNGSLRLRPNAPLPVSMRVLDHAGNVSVLKLSLVYRPGQEPAASYPHQYFLPAGQASIIDRGDLRLEIDSTALYRDCFFTYGQLPEASAGYFSDVHQLHTASVPLHGSARIALRPNRPVPDSLRSKVFVGSCNDDGRWTSYGGRWEAGNLTTTIPVFGDYAIFLDTTPPSVEVHRFPTDLRQADGFSVEITDNVSGGRLGYRGTIDGQWVLLEYDAKYDRLNYAFSSKDPGPGEHLFELEVEDARGNLTMWRRRFRR